MNDINLARYQNELREDIQAAADSAFMLGDIETYLALTRAFKLGINL